MKWEDDHEWRFDKGLGTGDTEKAMKNISQDN
jgi:hypothetical protein